MPRKACRLIWLQAATKVTISFVKKMRGSHSDLIMAKKVKEDILKPRLAIGNWDGCTI